MSFCHLHVHDQYSLLDGMGKAEHFLKKAKGLGQSHLAITNHGNIDGLIKFQKEAEKIGIIPIMGCEMYIVEDAIKKIKGEKRKHITILIKNDAGWKSVCNMLNYANDVGFYYRPRIDPEILLKNLDGIVVMSACVSSFIDSDFGVDLLEDLVENGVDFFLEVMPHDIDMQKRINTLCLEYSDEYGIPIVATNDAHYPDKGDWRAQEVLLAINNKSTMSDPNRFKFSFHGLHLRSDDEMIKTFLKQNILSKKQIAVAMDNTSVIASMCDSFKIKRHKVELPKISKNPDKELMRLCEAALVNMRLKGRELFMYRNRFLQEYNLIRKKKFSAYFLVVKDIIDMCNERGIMKGPGRGSVGCSLVAYLLGITLIDPRKHSLPFSRFINEDRIDYPDIDMDFEHGRIDEIKAYLEDKYGAGKVFSVSTFMKMKSAQVIRDVARVFDVPLYEVDEFSKVLSFKYESDDESNISHAVEESPEGRDFKHRYPHVVEFALKLEGQVRNAGQHAAAVVICDTGLHEKAILTRRKELVCNWDMDDLEYMGLLKIDILSLRNMTIIKEALSLVKSSYNRILDLDSITFEDPDVYKDMSDGKVSGIFQISGWATTKVIEQVQVENFQQVSDCIALSRPGPKDSGMTDEYIERRHSGTWQRKHSIYERITKSTYGVVVYQEQVMEIIRQVAGLPYSTADKIRKVIGKKRDAKEFEPFRKSFIKGCKRVGAFSIDEANEFWEGLQSHARYSFNKAHSVAYAIIAYWQQWLKHYFPVEYMSAILTFGPGKKEKKQEIINEIIAMGFIIIPPKVGISDGSRWIAKGKSLYMPFKEIKGIGDASLPDIEKLIIKNDCGMRGFMDCVETKKKVYRPGNSKGVCRILEEIGAFDEFNFSIPEGYIDYSISSFLDDDVPF